MKKLSLIFSLVAVLTFGFNYQTFAQAEGEPQTTEEVVDEAAAEGEEAVEEVVEEVEELPVATEEGPTEEKKGHQMLMQLFIEGGPTFMAIVLVCLIFGLAFSIERIITLALASGNTKSLLNAVEDNLASGNVEGAKDVCKASRSPVASIMKQGLERVNEGVDVVEKSVVAYGSVEMGRLEKGLSWISLAIGLAPMLGFMGTIIGMYLAFRTIKNTGEIIPSQIAGDIQVALITTLFGLVVAIILQIFYNYIVSRIDSLVNDMEDASITFVDMLVKHGVVKNN